MDIYNWVINGLMFSLPLSWLMCRQMYKGLKEKDKQIELYRRMKGIELGTTKIIEVDEEWFEGQTYKMPVVECCKVGPVTSEQNYCYKCGKMIIR